MLKNQAGASNSESLINLGKNSEEVSERQKRRKVILTWDTKWLHVCYADINLDQSCTYIMWKITVVCRNLQLGPKGNQIQCKSILIKLADLKNTQYRTSLPMRRLCSNTWPRRLDHLLLPILVSHLGLLLLPLLVSPLELLVKHLIHVGFIRCIRWILSWISHDDTNTT